MAIEFRCACGASYLLRDEYAGHVVACPHCGVESRVPDPHAPSAPSFAGGHPAAHTEFEEEPGESALAPAADLPTISADMLALEPESPPASAHDPRVDFEKGMSVAPFLSIVLILANTAIFAVTASRGALESREAIILAGALVRERVVAGEVWRGVSAMFLHGSVEHLLGNCVVLYILGMACEHAYGPLRTAMIYLLAGVGGAILSMTLSAGPSVGASGAIFGLMGAAIVFFGKYRDRFIVRDRRVGIVLVVWALYSIFTAFFQPFIDNGAHIGGLLTGALVAHATQPEILERIPAAAKH